jgi:hypothetical protein
MFVNVRVNIPLYIFVTVIVYFRVTVWVMWSTHPMICGMSSHHKLY